MMEINDHLRECVKEHCKPVSEFWLRGNTAPYIEIDGEYFLESDIEEIREGLEDYEL